MVGVVVSGGRAAFYTKIRGEGRIALRELQADPVLSDFEAAVYTKIRGEGRIALRELQVDPVLSDSESAFYTKIHRGGSYSSSRASDLTHRQTLKRISTRILTIKRGDELCRRRSGGRILSL